MSTLRILAERTHKILDGGTPSDDSRFTLRQIAEELKSGLAFLARRNFFENISTEDLHYANDEFRVTYKNQTIQADSESSLKYIDLPSPPPGIPKGRGIDIIPTTGSRTKFIGVRVEELFLMDLQPPIPNIIPYYLEDNKIWFKTPPTDVKVNVVITGGAKGLDEELNIPLSMETELIQLVIKQLAPELRIPIDTVNDGVDVRS